MNISRWLKRTAITAAVWIAVSPPAQAVVLDFDFNSLKDGASNKKVQQYMQGIVDLLHPGGSVVVTGARAEANDTGHKHAVGPVGVNAQGDPVVRSETLGTSDGGVHHDGLDSFLVNKKIDRITLAFSFPIYSASFDYEIFPDSDCKKAGGKNCVDETSPNWPDFTFKADGVQQVRTLGIIPGEQGTFPHSPSSGPTKDELAPQFLGASGPWLFPQGVTQLEFIDCWPTMIGIDNLRLSDAPVLPEPSSLLLLGSGLIGFIGAGRPGRTRRRRHTMGQKP